MQRDIFKINIARSLRVIRRRLVKYEIHETDFLFFFGIPKLLYCMLHQLFSSALMPLGSSEVPNNTKEILSKIYLQIVKQI